MAIEVYFREDVAHALAGALTVAAGTYAANGAGNADHLAGVLTLGRGLAVTFGLSWPAVIAEVRGALGAGAAGALLEGGDEHDAT